ncbi:MAG: hypothetical protein QOK17_1457 [Sphingomonadales bacterium]|nr:hypothetical protein [Sphingomonadales bacterium]
MTLALYSVFGLVIASEIELAELEPAASGAAADAVVRRGAVSAPEAGPGYSAAGDATLLTVPRVARYLISGGRGIVVDSAPGASERNVRLFLLGSAFGALLHQRGLLPLHANAIEIGDRAFAFCGHSGAGKSTVAAWFHDRGHRILADDVCVIGFDKDGRALAYPGIPRLRLWKEALEASGREAGAFARSFDDLDKYDVPTGREAPLRPLPLGAIYLLRRTEEGATPAEVKRFAGVDAVETLVSNTYRGAYLKTIGRTGEHLSACLRIARAVPLFMAERAWGFDRFDAQARRLEAHARSLADS